MIVFYRNTPDTFSDDVEETLRDLVVAHRVEAAAGAGAGVRIEEGETVVKGEPAIRAYLDELTREVRQQRLFQSDACYIDPETGTVC